MRMQDNQPNAKEIFNVARKIDCDETRIKYLEHVCDGNAVLMNRVAALLGVSEKANDLLKSPIVGVASIELPFSAEQIGSIIGRYKLMEQIGEGGMGSVYLAEQNEPVCRTVALKVIKAGFESPQVVARFEAERQSLAMMNHPNIANILDAGTTSQGRPYFVMELVRGASITEFCDRHKIDTQQRLKLFITICEAIQHAHQKGIIHRDIKPGNVLAELRDDETILKVIDFGIAKAIGQQTTNNAARTVFHQLMGTPLYMSPEQANLTLDVDTRSDIYSLGVLLYEILTGHTPFEKESFQQVSPGEIQRMICEVDPPSPSSRVSTLRAEILSTVSECRNVDQRKLSQQLRGELDWIVMKSLEKDRTRRYESASHFAADVRRYLNDEPIHAYPPSNTYKLKKFVQRNKLGVAAASFVALAFVVGVMGLGWGMILADQSRRIAERRQKDADAAAISERGAKQEALESQLVAEQASREALAAAESALESAQDTQAFSDFLVNDILSSARPKGERGGLGINVTVRDALDVADEKISETFQDRPRAEAIARHDLGVTFRSIGLFDKAEPHFRKALELRKHTLGAAHEATLRSQNSLAVLLNSLGKNAEAFSLQKETLELQKTRPGWVDDPASYSYMRNLASDYFTRRDYVQALSLSEEAVTHQRQLLKFDDHRLLFSMCVLGTCYVQAGKIDEGLNLLKEASDTQTQTYGRDAPETRKVLEYLARGYLKAGKFDQALPLLEENYGLRAESLGSQHPESLTAMYDLAKCHQESGRPKEALPLLQENCRLRRETLGEEHPNTLESLNLLGVCLDSLRRFEEAATQFAELLPSARKIFGDDDSFTVSVIFNLALQYQELRKTRSSIPLFEEALVRQRTLRGNDAKTRKILRQLALVYFGVGQFELATPILVERIELLELDSGANGELIEALTLLSICFEKRELFEEEEACLRRIVLAIGEQQGKEVSAYFSRLRSLGACLLSQRKFEEAEAIFLEVNAFYQRSDRAEDPQYKLQFGSVLTGRAIQQKVLEPIAALQKAEQAESPLLEAYEVFQTAQKAGNEKIRIQNLRKVCDRLVELYDFLNLPDQSAKFKAILNASVESAQPSAGF